MKTSLCIPTHKVTSEIVNTINYFFLSCQPDDEVVLVIDGGVYDPILDAFKSSIFSFRVIVLDKSFGPAYARNIAAKAALGQKLVFLDSDVVAHPPVLQKLSEVEKGTVLIPAVLPLGIATKSSKFFSDFALAPKSIGGLTLAVSACFSIDRVDFFDVNGFDENFKYPAGEDWDFFKRIQEFGTSVEFKPELRVFHRNPRTPFGLIRRSYRYAKYGSAIHETSTSMEKLNIEPRGSLFSVWALVPQILVLGALKVALSSFSIGNDSFYRLCTTLQKWQDRQYEYLQGIGCSKTDEPVKLRSSVSKPVRLAEAMRGFSISSPWEPVVLIRRDLDDRQKKKYRFLVFLWRTAYILGYMRRKW